MWELAQHDKKSGEIRPKSTFDSLEEAQTSLASSDENESYLLWVGEWPTDKSELHKLIEKELEVNQGKCLRIMPGVEITVEKKKSVLCRCPGRCFCVTTSSGCRCETLYRGRWYPCPGNC